MKTLKQLDKKYSYLIARIFWFFIIIAFLLVLCMIIIQLKVNNLQSQIDSLNQSYENNPKWECHNETIYEERADTQFNIIEIQCPCTSWGCLAYCYMENGTSTKYYNKSVGQKEVCNWEER